VSLNINLAGGPLLILVVAAMDGRAMIQDAVGLKCSNCVCGMISVKPFRGRYDV
jgi:hypothetical protein